MGETEALDIGTPLWLELVIQDDETTQLDYRVLPNSASFDTKLVRGVPLRSSVDPDKPHGLLAAVARGGSGSLRDSAKPEQHGLGYLLRAESKHIAVEARAIEQPARLEVVQRFSNQAVEDFIGAAGKFDVAPSSDRVDVTLLGDALPDGVVFLGLRGDSARRRRERLLALLSTRTEKYIGASRAIGDRHWRLTAFPESKPGRQVRLGNPWALDGLSHWPGGCQLRLRARVTTGRAIYAALLETKEQGDTAATLKLTDELVLPREPMTVVFDKDILFMRRMELRFTGDSLEMSPNQNGDVNLDIVLELVPDPLAARLDRSPPPVSARLLGRLAEPVEPGKGKRLMSVEPAPGDAFEEPALKALTEWATNDGKPLRAVMAAPAYERPGSAGLQIRWKVGDDVLVSVADGLLPEIIGPPRLSRAALTGVDAADMAMQGARVAVRSHGGDATADAVLTLEKGGQANIKASRVDLSERVIIDAIRVLIKGNVDVE